MGRGTRPRERFELQGTTTAHSPCFSHSHYARRGEERDRGKGSNCEEQPLLTHPVSYTHTTEGGARDEGRDRGKGSNCEKQPLLTHPVSHTTQGGARNEGRDRGKAARGEGRDRGTRDEGRGRRLIVPSSEFRVSGSELLILFAVNL